jgi:hypothetical protein
MKKSIGLQFCELGGKISFDQWFFKFARQPAWVISKSSTEVTTCTSSNILVWFGRDATEKGVAGLTESLISSRVKYERPNSWASEVFLLVIHNLS